MLLGEFRFACPRSNFSLRNNHRAPEQRTGSKKSKKSNQPPSGLLRGWDHNESQSTSAAPAAAGKDVASTDDDSMVQYGGLLEDGEDDEIEKAAVHKSLSTFKGGVGKKAMVRSSFHVFGFVGSITV